MIGPWGQPGDYQFDAPIHRQTPPPPYSIRDPAVAEGLSRFRWIYSNADGPPSPTASEIVGLKPKLYTVEGLGFLASELNDGKAKQGRYIVYGGRQSFSFLAKWPQWYWWDYQLHELQHLPPCYNRGSTDTHTRSQKPKSINAGHNDIFADVTTQQSSPEHNIGTMSTSSADRDQDEDGYEDRRENLGQFLSTKLVNKSTLFNTFIPQTFYTTIADFTLNPGSYRPNGQSF